MGYWIVKSSTVSIQARYKPTHITSGLSVTKEIAFGGPFMKGHVLRVSSLTATYDGQSICTGFPSSFSNDIVQIQYNSMGGTLQNGREGKALHVMHITLPNNVQIQINRWNEPNEGSYINVKIMMPKQPGQDGHCGNFNGNQADDDRLQIRARVGKTGVPAGDLIFPIAKTPIGQSNRPDINNCAKPDLEAA